MKFELDIAIENIYFDVFQNLGFRALGREEEEEDFYVDEEEEAPQITLSAQKIIEERSSMLICHFLFSVVWSVGATLDGPSRLKFDEYFRSLLEHEATSAKNPR